MPETILTATQLRMLKTIGREPLFTEKFYLTGGTALAGFYLHHRYSEDLDFFSMEEVDTLPIISFFKKHEREARHHRHDQPDQPEPKFVLPHHRRGNPQDGIHLLPISPNGKTAGAFWRSDG